MTNDELNRHSDFVILLGGLFPLHPGGRVMGQFGSTLQVQFAFNLLAVILDRFDARVKFLGNLSGLFPLPNQLKHFHLPIAQTLYRRSGDGSVSTDWAMEKDPRDCRGTSSEQSVE